jgi:DNA repair exonuclease SbcCD ATPase subunit
VFCWQVLTVLQNALDKLALIGAIHVDPRTQALELTQSVGENIGRMIDEQKALERRFQELIAQQPALRQLANKSKLQENQVQLQQVSEALKAATKQLCRNLKDNPNVSENLAKIAGQRQMLQNLLTACSTELHQRQTILPVIKVIMAAEQEEVRRWVGNQRGNPGLCHWSNVAQRTPAATAHPCSLCRQVEFTWKVLTSNRCLRRLQSSLSPPPPPHTHPTHPACCCSWRGRPPMRRSGRPPALCAASSRT